MTRRVRRPVRGFTIVELLVVIAVIAILMSMLVPALQAARESAKTTVCATHGRAIGQAVFFYGEESKGWVPRNGGIWAAKLFPYVGGVKESSDYADFWSIKTFLCPSYPDKQQILCYANNAWNFDDKHPLGCDALVVFGAEGVSRLNVWPRPESTIYVTDYECGLPTTKILLASDNPGTMDNKVTTMDVYSYDSLPRPENAARRVAIARHRSGQNNGFVDGHVSWIDSTMNQRWLWGGPVEMDRPFPAKY